MRRHDLTKKDNGKDTENYKDDDNDKDMHPQRATLETCVLKTNWSDFTWVGRQYAWWRSIVIATVRKAELKKGANVSDWGILYFPIFSIGNVMVFQINHLVRKKADDKRKRGRICGRLSTKVLSFKEMWSLAKTAATKVWRSSMSFPHHWPPELPLLPPNCWGTNKTLL